MNISKKTLPNSEATEEAISKGTVKDMVVKVDTVGMVANSPQPPALQPFKLRQAYQVLLEPEAQRQITAHSTPNTMGAKIRTLHTVGIRTMSPTTSITSSKPRSSSRLLRALLHQAPQVMSRHLLRPRVDPLLPLMVATTPSVSPLLINCSKSHIKLSRFLRLQGCELNNAKRKTEASALCVSMYPLRHLDRADSCASGLCISTSLPLQTNAPVVLSQWTLSSRRRIFCCISPSSAVEDHLESSSYGKASTKAYLSIANLTCAKAMQPNHPKRLIQTPHPDAPISLLA